MPTTNVHERRNTPDLRSLVSRSTMDEIFQVVRSTPRIRPDMLRYPP